MTTQKKKSPLREALKAQRQSLFRNGRYWFHILIWALAFTYLSISVFGNLNVGFTKGITISNGDETVDTPSSDVHFVGSYNRKVADTASFDKHSITISNEKDADTTPFSEYSFVYIGFLSILVAAIMVYSFLMFFIPYARFKKKKVHLWIGTIVNTSFWMLIIFISAVILGYKSNFTEHVDKHDIMISVMLSALFSGVVTGYFFAIYYFIDLYDQQKQLKLYKSALTGRLEAETAFLLNQINPHFLFNTLNNIYSLLLNHSEDAIFAAKELQHMMQYILNECNHDYVSLEGEIEFLKNYINLEKLRNQKDQIKVQFIVTGNPEGKTIAPLLLINFLENAFKHGVKAGFEEAYILVKLDIRKDSIVLEVENSKPPLSDIPGLDIIHEGGIGIKNVRRRLDILYPNRYKLNLQNTPNQFLVLLSINLHQQ